MTCQDYDLLIGDYVDDALTGEVHAEIDLHLSSCERCRAVAADFGAIRAAALALEPHVPPPHVWTKLSAAYEAETARRQHGFWGVRWQTFAAAAAMLTITAGLSWIGVQLKPAAEHRLAMTTGAAPARSIEAELAHTEAQFTSAIAGLEKAAEAERTALDAETAGILQANLTVIDTAIGESRAALKSQPDNDVAQESLFGALRSKIALLQDTLTLINEMRKGNQEGAARIVSGLNQ